MIHRITEIISFILFLVISLGALGIFTLTRAAEAENRAIREFAFDAQMQH